jgi:uncharacterized membrane protein YfcA
MAILDVLALFAAGLAAGGLTTVAGLGGGILLVAGLSLFWTPAMVLATTTPALFVGNASRAAMLREEIAWPVVGRFALAGVPAAFLASLAAASLPADAVRAAIAVLLLAFVVHELRPGASAPADLGSPWLATAAGAIAGTVSGLAGGAGFVATPLLDRLGLRPTALVATGAAAMALVHLVKGAGFGLAAVLTPAALPAAAALAVGVVAGNAWGARVLRGLSRDAFRRLMLGALALAAGWLLIEVIW